MRRARRPDEVLPPGWCWSFSGFLALTFVVALLLPGRAPRAPADGSGSASLENSPVQPTAPAEPGIEGNSSGDARLRRRLSGAESAFRLPRSACPMPQTMCLLDQKPTHGAIIALRGDNLDRVTGSSSRRRRAGSQSNSGSNAAAGGAGHGPGEGGPRFRRCGRFLRKPDQDRQPVENLPDQRDPDPGVPGSRPDQLRQFRFPFRGRQAGTHPSGAGRLRQLRHQTRFDPQGQGSLQPVGRGRWQLRGSPQHWHQDELRLHAHDPPIAAQGGAGDRRRHPGGKSGQHRTVLGLPSPLRILDRALADRRPSDRPACVSQVVT